jgi:hypothetical protein
MLPHINFRTVLNEASSCNGRVKYRRAMMSGNYVKSLVEPARTGASAT